MAEPRPTAGLLGDGPPATLLAGERQLLLAVLVDAVESYLRCRRARDREARRLFEETQGWFASRDRTTLFSFEAICDALDLDPDYVRRMLVARTGGRRHRRPASGASH